jgi:hypothetical protein
MAHFARLDENNVVTQVIVVDNVNILDESGQESEEIGIQFCKNLLGQDTNWLQTSYNGSFRKRFAGKGSRYIPEKDIFATAPNFPSWTVYDVETDEWQSPIPRPIPSATDEYHWVWNESILNWEIAYYPPVPSEES